MEIKERRELEIFLLETPQQEIAQSLNAHHYKLDNDDRDSFRRTFFEIYDCVHSWPMLEGQNLAEHILEHENKINQIFDNCPTAWRFPIYIDIDLYSTFRHYIDDGKKIFQHIMQAWQWYAFFRAKKSELAFYKTAHIFDGTPQVQAQQFMDIMIKGVWGSMQSSWVSSLGLGNVCDKYQSEITVAVQAFVDNCSDGCVGFKKAVITAAKNSDLPFEILFIYNNCFGAPPEDYVDALNFLLCQKDMYSYRDILAYTTYEEKGGENIIPVWCHWVERYLSDIMLPGTPHRALFDFAFSLDDAPLIKDGRVLACHKRKEGTKGLPTLIVKTIEKCYPKYRENAGRARKNGEKVAGEAMRIVSNLSSSPVSGFDFQPKSTDKKESITIPNKASIFIRGIEKQQLVCLDLSGVRFPEGTVLKFVRHVPNSKTPEIFNVLPETTNNVPAIMGQSVEGHFMYELTVTLPRGEKFKDGKTYTVLTERIYAKGEATPEEEADRREKEKTAPIKTSPVIPGTVTTSIKTTVAAVLETPTPLLPEKTLADTVIAWDLSLESNSYSVEIQESGTVVFQLAPYLIGLLHEEAFGTLQIAPDGSASPTIQKNEILTQLQDIASELREKKQVEHDLALQAEQEEKEYQILRAKFQPFYDFIAEQTFIDKDKTELFDKASVAFRNSLTGFRWSLPRDRLRDGKIQFRDAQNKIKIIYNNIGSFSSIVGDGRALSKAEEGCYHEIAEAFSHLALFYTAEYRERQKMISKEKKFQKDMLKGAEAYEALLEEGRGRLVQYSSPEKGNIFVSKFPLDDKPHMLAEKVGHDTVEKALQENENSELCYRRDILRINGEIDEKKAGEQNQENTLQNLADLRQSPRARYILRKRILITLGYEKFSGDDTRRSIQPEKKGSTKASAFEILHSLKKENKLESKEQIDEEFMDAYIDLLTQKRIRFQYVWPLSVSLADHRKQLAKIQKQKKPTAD